jgi:hypothetical protein
LEKFDNVEQLNNWNNEEKCVQFCLTLPKSTEAWYVNLITETKESFELLKQSFKSRFSQKTNRVYLYSKFMKVKQDGRDVSVYIEEVLSKEQGGKFQSQATKIRTIQRASAWKRWTKVPHNWKVWPCFFFLLSHYLQ